jgi:hypothetical protein
MVAVKDGVSMELSVPEVVVVTMAVTVVMVKEVMVLVASVVIVVSMAVDMGIAVSMVKPFEDHLASQVRLGKGDRPSDEVVVEVHHGLECSPGGLGNHAESVTVDSGNSPDNFLEQRMVQGELLVQLEAVVHGVLLPDQLMTDVAITLVHNDQPGSMVTDDRVNRFRRHSHGFSKLLKSSHADQLEGATGVPEPPHEQLASLATLLLRAAEGKSPVIE